MFPREGELDDESTSERGGNSFTILIAIIFDIISGVTDIISGISYEYCFFLDFLIADQYLNNDGSSCYPFVGKG